MKHSFYCSLYHYGLLGGGLYLDENSLTYRTGKIIEEKYRCLSIRYDEIKSVEWKGHIFHKATFILKNGESYSFLIFNKKRFIKVFESVYKK